MIHLRGDQRTGRDADGHESRQSDANGCAQAKAKAAEGNARGGLPAKEGAHQGTKLPIKRDQHVMI